MKTEHTPGPWILNDAGPNSGNIIRFEIVSGDFRICEIEDGWIDANNKRVASKRDMANARLIAAAPDLLAACESIMEFLSNGTPVHPGSLVQAEVFNAIARAKGGST